MAYDPWDWTRQTSIQSHVAPLAANLPAPQATMSSPVNTTGPLQQMVQQQVMNQGFKKAFADAPPVDPSKLAPVSDATPTLINPPTNEALAPLAGTDAAAVQGADLAVTGAEAATAGEAATAATAAESGGLLESLSQLGAYFAADGTTSVPNKGGK